MFEMQVYEYKKNQEVRTIILPNDQILVSARDVWTSINFSCGTIDIDDGVDIFKMINYFRAIEKIGDKEKHLYNFYTNEDKCEYSLTTNDDILKVVFVNEHGLSQLISMASKPKDKKFREWIYEVIAQIKKKGCYYIQGSVIPAFVEKCIYWPSRD